MRLWRWLCCRTGHHRETVRSGIVYTTRPNPYGYSIAMHDGLEWECRDCGERRPLASALTPTPSRRYALRGKA